ncbi:MAG: hypothetical protein IT546_07845 [Caulobacteraceae bacterium]|nr:hypothetical protein [Caulobacteraceae bacterium]
MMVLAAMASMALAQVDDPNDRPSLPAFVDHTLAASSTTSVSARCLDGRLIEVEVTSGVRQRTEVRRYVEDGLAMAPGALREWSAALGKVRSVIGVEVTCAGPSDLVTVEGWPFDTPDRPHRLRVNAFITDGRVSAIREVRVK